MPDVAHSTTSITGGHTSAVAGVSAGFISAADQTKLNGIASGAQVCSEANVRTALAALTADPNFNGRKITNIADPSAASDVASKAYVDSVAAGLSVKPSCRVVSTANQATLSGLLVVIDGVTLGTPGMRVLLTGQTTQTQNGIWLVQSGAWTRPTDFPIGGSASGSFTFIEQGTVHEGDGWVCVTDLGSDVIDTNNLAFTQFSGAGEITASSPLTKTGNTLAIQDTTTGQKGSIQLGGDLSGTVTSQTVSKANGATLPASPSAGDVKKVLQVSAANTLTYDILIEPVLFGSTGHAGSAATRFQTLGGVIAATANESSGQWVAPWDGNCFEMQIYHDTALATDSVTYTARKNKSDQTMTVTIAATNTTGSDLAHNFDFSKGDRLCVKSVQSAGEAGATGGPRALLLVKRR